jgi:hypothetical protein
MSFGPMQVLVVGFESTEMSGEIAAELRRLREHDIVRLVDVLVVAKAQDGTVTAIETSDLSADESVQLGAFVGALIGIGGDGEEGAVAGAAIGAEAAREGDAAGGRGLVHRRRDPARDPRRGRDPRAPLGDPAARRHRARRRLRPRGELAAPLGPDRAGCAPPGRDDPGRRLTGQTSSRPHARARATASERQDTSSLR